MYDSSLFHGLFPAAVVRSLNDAKATHVSAYFPFIGQTRFGRVWDWHRRNSRVMIGTQGSRRAIKA